jgi:hypothetical protein
MQMFSTQTWQMLRNALWVFRNSNFLQVHTDRMTLKYLVEFDTMGKNDYKLVLHDLHTVYLVLTWLPIQMCLTDDAADVGSLIMRFWFIGPFLNEVWMVVCRNTKWETSVATKINLTTFRKEMGCFKCYFL